MQYVAPSTAEAASALLADTKGSAFVLAGGSDLLVKMKGGNIEPDLIIDIKRISGMTEVKANGGGFSIGAATPCAALSENAALVKAWPGVVEAANLIGSKQVQGRCTMVGNLCNASPAADSVPALVAAGATVVVHGPKGKRTVPAGDIPTGPGKTSLGKGEFITSIELPARAPHSGDAYLRFIPRTEMDIAVVSAGVHIGCDAGGVVKSAKIVLGAVGPTVIEVPAAAAAIIGSKLDDAALAKLDAACAAAAKPIDDKRGTVHFRTKVAGVLARRAAKIAYARAGGK